MPHMDKLSSYATTIAVDGLGDTCITYHNTCIVRFNPERVALGTGGWDTVIARRKMNQAAVQFRLPYSVFREKGETYVRPAKGWLVKRAGLEAVKSPSAIPMGDYVELLRA